MKIITLAFLFNISNVVALECKNNNYDANDFSRILLLSKQVDKICDEKDKPKSKWISKKLTKEECISISKKIENNNLESALVPEILSVVDIVKAECGEGDDPQVVVKDVMPFSVDGISLFFEWDNNNKLVVKDNYKFKSDDYVSMYSKKDLFDSPVKLTAAQVKVISNLDLKESKTESWKTNGAVKKWWSSTKNEVLKILVDGSTDVYIPMIAYHDRNTYDAEHLKRLNEAALGIGVGKSIINNNGNTEMLFAMAHLDSHSDVEFNVGYGWQKNFKVTDKTTVGVGYAAGVISRKDLNDHIPLPFILPMASVTYDKKFSLNGVLIPKLDGGINHGAVVFIFGKYTFDK